MLPLIAKYLHWYVADCCGCIAGLNDQNKQRHMPYHIRQMSVNGVSMERQQLVVMYLG